MKPAAAAAAAVVACVGLALAPTASRAQTTPPPAAAPPASSPLQPAPTRGRLLYETHCIACHDTQVHWRDKRTVRDWAGLVEQVRLWQDRSKLQWREADIVEVARHLNAAIYRLPRPGPA